MIIPIKTTITPTKSLKTELGILLDDPSIWKSSESEASILVGLALSVETLCTLSTEAA